MRKVFYVLMVLILLAIGMGLIRGWFSVSLARDSEIGRTEVRLGIDDGQMRSDVQWVKEKITGAVDQAKEKTETP